MNKKIFLTSAAIMCMACPAIAENFPGDGNMLENKTYANAAVYDNTGVYEGTATANAYYTTNNYNVSAGSYFTGLDANNDATTATCTSGNYCPGVQSTTYDAENSAFIDDGLKACPNGYASSDLGASADTQCYRTCDIANMGANGTIATIAHAATLSGNDYYGNGNDTCEPATCVAGWHRKAGVNGSAIANAIGSEEGSDYGYINNAGTLSYQGMNSGVNHDATYYGLNTNDHNAFSVYYGNNVIIHGHGRCSSIQGERDTINHTFTYNTPTAFASLIDETDPTNGGRYCYCQTDRYTSGVDNTQLANSYWVYLGDSSSANNCARECASACASSLKGNGDTDLGLRISILNTIQGGPATCEANTINITWNDASAEDIAATGAATTVYEGDIKTPLKAVTKPGKTFVGWKFVKPAATPVEP